MITIDIRSKWGFKQWEDSKTRGKTVWPAKKATDLGLVKRNTITIAGDCSVNWIGFVTHPWVTAFNEQTIFSPWTSETIISRTQITLHIGKFDGTEKLQGYIQGSRSPQVVTPEYIGEKKQYKMQLSVILRDNLCISVRREDSRWTTLRVKENYLPRVAKCDLCSWRSLSEFLDFGKISGNLNCHEKWTSDMLTLINSRWRRRMFSGSISRTSIYLP